MALITVEDQYAQLFHMTYDNDYLGANEDTNITWEQKVAMLKFILKNINETRRLDLRLPQTIARTIKANPNNWERKALRFMQGM